MPLMGYIAERALAIGLIACILGFWGWFLWKWNRIDSEFLDDIRKLNKRNDGPVEGD